MNQTDWTAIAGKLTASGFTVSYEHLSYDPQHPLWCTNASRDGRKWTTMGRDLGTAFLELEKQTQEAGVDWRAILVLETSGKAAQETPAVNRRA